MKRTCVQCGKEFYLNNGEVRYFKERKLALPKRCPECRAFNKAKKLEATNNAANISKETKGFFARLLSMFK